jgi:hypothetical protein
MFHRTVALAACATSALACGSSSPSSSRAAQGAMSVNGTFGGYSLAAQDAIAQIQTQTTAGATITSADIVIASIASLCDRARTYTDSPGVSFLDFSIGGPGTQIVPGTYMLNGGNDAMFASAIFGREDASCVPTLSEVGMSGTITITGASPTSLSGSFDAQFYQAASNGTAAGSPDHVTGTFDASVCSAPATDGGAHACGK